MKLHELSPAEGSKKSVKRIGRGTASVSYTHLDVYKRQELRNVPCNCMATIGVVGNADHANVKIGKAGRKRNMGFRPTVRGSVMNPNDHPHGGGEGKSPIGRPGPCTPWGLSLIHI